MELIWKNRWAAGASRFLGSRHRTSRCQHRLTKAIVEALEARTMLSTYTVNSLLDTSGSSSVRTLPWALGQANGASDAPTITFDPALFLNGPVTITLAEEVDLYYTSPGSLTIQGPTGANGLTINAAQGGFGVVSGSSAEIDNLTITAGVFNDGNLTLRDSTVSGADSGSGSGIFNNWDANLATYDSTITNFTGANNGGGILNLGTATINDSNITNNYSTGDGGGGIYNQGTLTVVGSKISGNTTGAHGGGIYNAGSLTVRDSVISNNSASYSGGGIYGDASVINSTISNNSAAHGNGGGIDAFSALTVTNSTLSGNSAAHGNGGGINVQYNDSLGVVNSTISGNSAMKGGGIALSSDNYYYLRSLTDCTITGNTATNSGGGGGISVGPRSTALNSFDFPPTLAISGSIVAGNTNNDDIVGQVSGSYDLIGSNTGMSGISNGHSANHVGTSSSPINPLLSSLGNYGGPTQTMALLPGSPALNGSALFHRFTTDQRGFARPRVSGLTTVYDIGAFQVQSSPLLVNTNQDDPVGINQLSLRDAINLANVTLGVQTISFASSVTANAPATITLGSELPELYNTSSGSLTIQGPTGTNGLTIDSGGQGSVFNIPAGATVEIDNLIIVGGSSRGAVDDSGIFNQGNLTLRASTVSGRAGLTGRGIFNYSDANLAIYNSTITNNAGSEAGGGILNSGSATINGSTITNNSPDSAGGGIFNQGALTVIGSTISGNTAIGNGGGIYDVSNNSLSVSNSVISDNHASYSGGGIFFESNNGGLTVSGSTISDNTAQANGGGIDFANDGSGVSNSINNSTLSGNSAVQGGAICIYDGYLGVGNSTISGNTAVEGGGIYNQYATLAITDSTISGNQATGGIGAGGGIKNDPGSPGDPPPSFVQGTIVAGNTPGGDLSGLFSGSYNLIGDGSGNLPNGSHNILGTISSPINPLLSPLGNYGGPTQTMALLPGSPALNAGAAFGRIITDQRGMTRSAGSAPDIGAYELQPPTWTRVHPAPLPAFGAILLLPDGSALENSFSPNQWARLVPDANGSYANGTWTVITPSNQMRYFMASQVLPDGRLFIAGGEYGNGRQTAEIYDLVTNTWTELPPLPDPLMAEFILADSETAMLPDGRVLIASATAGNTTVIYDPVTNTWAAGASILSGSITESDWTTLADGSILLVDQSGLTAERYIPSTGGPGSWVSAGAIPVHLDEGPGFLLADGRAFFLGNRGHTAYYNPTTNSWTAGPDIPNGLAADDAPAAMLRDGTILCAVSPFGMSLAISYYIFNPITNSFTSVAGGPKLTNTENTTMVELPDGTVLVSGGGDFQVFNPNGGVLPAAAPAITSVNPNGDGSFHLTGTLLNGISEGAAFGDDGQMSTNWPIVSLQNAAGNLFYARTFGWSSTGLQTGSTPESTNFALPLGLPAGTYQLKVSANGISSVAVPFTVSATPNNTAPTVATAAAANPSIVTGKTAALSVLGADDSGASHLTYTWTTLSTPARVALPSFSINGSNNARNTTVTFPQLGTYTFRVYITDPGGLSTSSDVTVTVTPTLSQFYFSSPDPVTIQPYGEVEFDVIALDQFGNLFNGTVSWAITSGAGTITGHIGDRGLYDAPGFGTSATIVATLGNFSATSVVGVLASSPWQTVNWIGSTGSAGGNNDSFTFASDQDTQQFMYQSLTGDFTITARVSSQQWFNNPDFPIAWAGIMISNSLDPSFTGLQTLNFDFFTAGTNHSLRFKYQDPNLGSGQQFTSPVSAPDWIRVVRSGDTFTTYSSPNGITWTQRETISIPMTQTVFVGLQLQSFMTNSLGTTVFDDVAISN